MNRNLKSGLKYSGTITDETERHPEPEDSQSIACWNIKGQLYVILLGYVNGTNFEVHILLLLLHIQSS